MTNSLTTQLGSFVSEFSFSSIPDEALSLVRSAFADTVAVIMAGIDEDAVRIVHQQAIDNDAGTDARVCLTDIRASSATAALVGGTAAHALDYDDQSLSGHPSAVLVPAILAEGDRLGSTGRDLVAAYVVGYEIWAELIGRNTGYHARGWHPTSVFGTIGAAASVAYLNGFNSEQTIHALAIAASHAGGLASNFGTMTKPLHAGLAARNGVVAVNLAKGGLTGSHDVFDTATGYLGAFASTTPPDLTASPRLGGPLYLLNHRLCIKRYPTCYFMHRSFEAAAGLLAGTNPDDVQSVDVTMGRGQTAVLTYDRPRTALEAKFSGPFAIAAAALHGKMGLAELSDDVVMQPEMQAFYPKVRLIAVDEYDERDPAHSPSDSVRITLRDGRVLDSGPIATVRGHANDPLSPAELWGKFEDCTAATHSTTGRRTLFDALMTIDTLSSAAAIPSSDHPGYMAQTPAASRLAAEVDA